MYVKTHTLVMRKRDAKDKEKKKVREQKGIRIKSVLTVDISIDVGRN